MVTSLNDREKKLEWDEKPCRVHVRIQVANQFVKVYKFHSTTVKRPATTVNFKDSWIFLLLKWIFRVTVGGVAPYRTAISAGHSSKFAKFLR